MNNAPATSPLSGATARPAAVAFALWTLTLTLAFALLGCESRVSLGQRCSTSADCQAPLICAVGGRCRVECTTSADCPANERCLVDGAGVPACSVDRETCTTDCAEGLECVRGECQSGCTSSTECPDSVCTIEGYCLTPSRDDAGLVDASDSDAGLDASTECGPSPRVLDVAVGGYETCAVLADNTVWCWGYFPLIGADGSGEACLGGTRACYPRPVQIPGITDALEIVLTGRSYGCVRATSGRVSCWGGLDTPDRTVRVITLALPPGPLVATRLIAGDQHVCAERGEDLYCWGQQSRGRLGNGLASESLVMIPGRATELPLHDMPLGQPFAASYEGTVALSTDGLVRGVGANEHGQLGATPSMSEATAVQLPRSGATAIAASSATTCVLVGGRPRCWGLATDLLGPSPSSLVDCLDGERSCSVMPVDVSSPVVFEDLVADPLGNTMYGITDDSFIYGWGTSDTGLLASAHVETPTPLPALEGAQAHRLSVGGGAACAVLEGTSELRCWGLDSYGQLGRGVAHERGDPDPELALARPPCW